jgi:hypothetical protein
MCLTVSGYRHDLSRLWYDPAGEMTSQLATEYVTVPAIAHAQTLNKYGQYEIETRPVCLPQGNLVLGVLRTDPSCKSPSAEDRRSRHIFGR